MEMTGCFRHFFFNSLFKSGVDTNINILIRVINRKCSVCVSINTFRWITGEGILLSISFQLSIIQKIYILCNSAYHPTNFSYLYDQRIWAKWSFSGLEKFSSEKILLWSTHINLSRKINGIFCPLRDSSMRISIKEVAS